MFSRASVVGHGREVHDVGAFCESVDEGFWDTAESETWVWGSLTTAATA